MNYSKLKSVHTFYPTMFSSNANIRELLYDICFLTEISQVTCPRVTLIITGSPRNNVVPMPGSRIYIRQ